MEQFPHWGILHSKLSCFSQVKYIFHLTEPASLLRKTPKHGKFLRTSTRGEVGLSRASLDRNHFFTAKTKEMTIICQ